LVHLYLNCPNNTKIECPNERELSEFKKAIEIGDISYHCFPFNSQIEILDESLLEFGLKMSHDLDIKFNFTKKIVFGQRDVPGFFYYKIN
jgi:hypothetical protein